MKANHIKGQLQGTTLIFQGGKPNAGVQNFVTSLKSSLEKRFPSTDIVESTVLASFVNWPEKGSENIPGYLLLMFIFYNLFFRHFQVVCFFRLCFQIVLQFACFYLEKLLIPDTSHNLIRCRFINYLIHFEINFIINWKHLKLCFCNYIY